MATNNSDQAKTDRFALQRLWRGLFGSILNTIITLAIVGLGAWILPPLFRWAVLDAVWIGDAAACAGANGACWAFIGAKLRFILFAFFPPAEHWRPSIVIGLAFCLVAVTGMPRFWRPSLVSIWLIVIVATWMLMSGGGIASRVPSDQWGGVVLTILIAIFGFAGAFPIGLALALARRSRLGGIRTLAIVFIEIMRGVPMIAVLYVAMLLVPMMLSDITLAKLARAEIALTLFYSAYLAEILRAGVQAIPLSQFEGADSLGFGYWGKMRLVILPQAIRSVIPALVNLAIGILQSTSLVVVIGLFDMLNAGRNAAMDPIWLGFYDEAFLFVGLIYFLLCFGGSRYSIWLEQYLKRAI